MRFFRTMFKKSNFNARSNNFTTSTDLSTNIQSENSSIDATGFDLEEPENGSDFQPEFANHDDIVMDSLKIESQSDVSTSKPVKFGDLYKTGKQFAHALKVTARSWQVEGKRILCQSKSNSDLWYVYVVVSSGGYTYMCKKCEVQRRYSGVTCIIQNDSSKTLWSVENHGEECLRKYRDNGDVIIINRNQSRSRNSKVIKKGKNVRFIIKNCEI